MSVVQLQSCKLVLRALIKANVYNHLWMLFILINAAEAEEEVIMITQTCLYEYRTSSRLTFA